MHSGQSVSKSVQRVEADRFSPLNVAAVRRKLIWKRLASGNWNFSGHVPRKKSGNYRQEEGRQIRKCIDSLGTGLDWTRSSSLLKVDDLSMGTRWSKNITSLS